MRARVRHELKTWPEFFQATKRGIKRFELRRDDRPDGFQVGDELLLREYHKTMSEGWKYTGREVLVRVDYVMPAETVDALMSIHPNSRFPSKNGYIIMSVSLVN